MDQFSTFMLATGSAFLKDEDPPTPVDSDESHELPTLTGSCVRPLVGDRSLSSTFEAEGKVPSCRIAQGSGANGIHCNLLGEEALPPPRPHFPRGVP